MDVAAPLAGQLVQILAPFLPYLLKAGDGLGNRAAEQIEDRVASWPRVSGRG